MYTLGDVTPNPIQREESFSLNMKFRATAIVNKGDMVKLGTAAGDVDPATLTAAFGIVTVGCKAIGENVTVQTPFNTELYGQADGALAVGDPVSANGVDTTTKMQKYKKSVSTNTVVGICLSVATSGAQARIGILRTFYVVA